MKGPGSPTRITAGFACRPRSDPGQFHRHPDIFPSFEVPAAIEVLLPSSSTPLTRANVNPKQCPDPEVPAGQLAVCSSSLLLGSDIHSSSPVYCNTPCAAPLCIISPGVQLPCVLLPPVCSSPVRYHPTPWQHTPHRQRSTCQARGSGLVLPPSITEDHLALSRLESIPFDFQQSPGRPQLLRRAFSSSSPQTGRWRCQGLCERASLTQATCTAPPSVPQRAFPCS